jgi:hypothetical protein
MIPPEKPDIIYLLNAANTAYMPFAVRLVNMLGKAETEKIPTNTIS